MNVRYVFEMQPIDFWGLTLSVKEAFGSNSGIKPQIKEYISRLGLTCKKVRVGVIANPKERNFSRVIYAKVKENGLVYAFSEVDLTSICPSLMREVSVDFLPADTYLFSELTDKTKYRKHIKVIED
jgi:hypothetical protein